MLPEELITLFIDTIPSGNREHMLEYFAGNALRGNIRPFTFSLLRAVQKIDAASAGYAQDIFGRIGSVAGIGEQQYEALIQSLGEIFVTSGFAEAADSDDSGSKQFAHEPGVRGQKNPECEARILGSWCAVEVKTPKLIAYRRRSSEKDYQLLSRFADGMFRTSDVTLPRDNPVKDFLVSADAKFASYETFRPGAFRLLAIVWDDFCQEPIAALLGPSSGLLTAKSFHIHPDGSAVTYPHLDGVIIIRQQHQLRHATREEPLDDGVTDALLYRHDGFPPKAFIPIPGSRHVPLALLEAINCTPIERCLGAEYIPADLTFWL